MSENWHRTGDGAAAEIVDLRRTRQCSRRHRSGTNSRSAGRPQTRFGTGDFIHQPQPGRGEAAVRTRPGVVSGTHDGACAGGGHLREPAASVHAAVAPIRAHSGPRYSAGAASASVTWRATVAAVAAERVRIPD